MFSSIINYSTIDYEHNWGGLMYLVKEVNKHALLITITKIGEVQFSIRFFHDFYCKVANATLH